MDRYTTATMIWSAVTLNTTMDRGTNETFTPEQPRICDYGLGFFRWFVYTWIVAPLIGFGLIGNCIAFVVLFRKYRFRPNGLLLLSLTVFDTVVLCLQAVTHVWQVVQVCHQVLVSHSWYFFLYRYCYPLSYISRLSIMGITMCLSWNRWIAICRPFTAKYRLKCCKAVLQILGIVSVSVLFSLPRFYELQLVDSTVKLTTLVKNGFYNIAYRTVTFSLIMYVIPIGYVVFTCADICRSFKIARDYYRNLNCFAKDNFTEIIQATRIALVLCVLTLLCNAPAFTSQIIWSLYHLNDKFYYLDAYRPYFVIIGNTTVAVGSATNIVVYCWCSKGFRQAFCTMLLPLKWTSSARPEKPGCHNGSKKFNYNCTNASDPTSLLCQESQL